MLPTNSIVRVGGRVAFALFVAMPLQASDDVLFPVPLHLVRRIEDPIAGATAEVDEYCTGNKLITVRGNKTAIADYERQELLEIDRATATYSFARFDEIAKARAIVDPPAPKRNAIETSARREVWKTTALGVRSSAIGRSADAFEVSAGAVKVELAVDREITLSRPALDALTGAGYPSKPSDQQEAVARACARMPETPTARTTNGGDAYGLPLDQSITFEAGAKRHLTVRNTIVRITSELPPPELLAIPAGAKLVESRAAQMQRLLRELGDVTAAKP